MLWGKTSRPAPRVSTTVPFIILSVQNYFFLHQVLIECCPYLLTQKDANGRLPLHMASISPYPLPLSLLINNRPPKCAPLEVNCVDADMRTPLHYASAANNLENVQVHITHVLEV